MTNRSVFKKKKEKKKSFKNLVIRNVLFVFILVLKNIFKKDLNIESVKMSFYNLD